MNHRIGMRADIKPLSMHDDAIDRRGTPGYTETSVGIILAAHDQVRWNGHCSLAEEPQHSVGT
jgi:hypothetical protein